MDDEKRTQELFAEENSSDLANIETSSLASRNGNSSELDWDTEDEDQTPSDLVGTDTEVPETDSLVGSGDVSSGISIEKARKAIEDSAIEKLQQLDAVALELRRDQRSVNKALAAHFEEMLYQGQTEEDEAYRQDIENIAASFAEKTKKKSEEKSGGLFRAGEDATGFLARIKKERGV